MGTSELASAVQCTVDLASRALSVFTLEELAAADPDDLRLVLACHELLAAKIVAFARIKTNVTAKNDSGVI